MNAISPASDDRTPCLSDNGLYTNQAEEMAPEFNCSSVLRAHRGLRKHLVRIGAKSLHIETPGPDGSNLCWYSMRSHIIILQTFDDDEQWEIYTSLSGKNKASLVEACSGLRASPLARSEAESHGQDSKF